MRKSKLTDGEIVCRYLLDEDVKDIGASAGISRTALYDTLHRNGISTTRRRVLDLICKFCGKPFKRPRSHKTGSYCSTSCFHKDRSKNHV